MAAAMASPAPSSARKRHHPPYNEMIHRAIESLKEKNGSSRTAIYKFIAANYSDLPPAHDALLSTHIRRLCKKGVLRMVKHSYMLAPTSAGAQTPGLKPRGRPPKSKGQNTVSIKRGRPRKSPGADLVPPAERKKRGRPPKSPGGDPVPPAERGKRVRPSKSPGADLVPPAERGKRGRPRKSSSAADPARKPGRPPKTQTLATTVLPVEMRKRGRPLKSPGAAPLPSAEKRKLKPGPRPRRKLFSVNPVPPAKRGKRGRPPKTPPSAPVTASTETRKPGRPRKVPQAATVPDSGAIKRRGLKSGRIPMHAAMKALVQKRKPGRPKKALSATSLATVVSGSSGIPSPVNASVVKRKLGRPKKGMQHELKPMSAAVKESVGKKKPGRPKKILSPFPSAKAVDGRPSFLNGSHQLPEKVAGEGEPGLNPMSAAANTSAEKRKPGRPKKAISSSSLVLGVVDKAREIVERGSEPMPAVVTTPVEKMMPAIKKCSQPPNKNNMFGPATGEEDIFVEEKRKRSVGWSRKNECGRTR